MAYLLMVRHGLSQYNLENRFTGNTDVPLSEEGIREADAAGRKLKLFPIDIAFTSVLRRAEDTLQFILDQHLSKGISIVRSALLNERDYGQLQGLNKAEVAKTYGDEQVLIWRRGYKVKPPGGESLEDTYNRVVPYLNSHILPELKKGRNVLVVAHGNSLRAVFKALDQISDEDIVNLNIRTGDVYQYQFDEQLNILSRKIL